MDDQWGPWIEHDLGGCPVQDGQIVEIHCRYDVDLEDQGIVTMGRDYSTHYWSMADLTAVAWLKKTGERLGILRYRVRKPRGLTLLENIANGYPTGIPQDQTEDA